MEEQALKHEYDRIQKEIAEICYKTGRSAESVKLMLVSKTVPPERIMHAVNFGHRLFGENKVQELAEKVEYFKDTEAKFHFIGHLQTNKIKKCIECTNMIHSVDRISLAKELHKQLSKVDKTMDVLLQVNTSNEESKFGVAPGQLLDLVKEVSKFSTLKIKGLMTLAKFSSKEEEVRPCFVLLRKLAEDVKAAAIDGVSMDELSMGMSSDYKIAIEEGATMVRIGTAVFGARNLPDSYYWPEKK